MAAPKRREYKDIDDLMLAKPSKSARVEGMLTQLSPMKQGRFFDGCLADDKTSLRLVGFDAKKLEELEQLKEDEKPLPD